MAQAQSNQYDPKVNTFMRQRLLATALPNNFDLGTQSTNKLGDTLRFRLNNSGLTHRLRVFVKLDCTAATAAPTLSPNGFLNILNKVTLTDYDQNSRISTTPAMLQARNSVRERRLDGFNQQIMASNNGSQAAVVNNTFKSPFYNLVVGATSVSGFFDVPLCFDSDAGDLRGLLATNQYSGEAYLTLDVATILAAVSDDTKVFNNGTVITAPIITVTVQQQTFLQQVDPVLGGLNRGFPFPALDCVTNYEITSGIIADQLVANAEKTISLPTGRMVNAIYYRYVRNSLQGADTDANDLISHAVWIGDSLKVKQNNRDFQLFEQRQAINCDLPRGMFFTDFIGLPGTGRQPVQIAEQGNVSLKVIPGAAPIGTSFIEFCTESMYPRGMPLGAIVL